MLQRLHFGQTVAQDLIHDLSIVLSGNCFQGYNTAIGFQTVKDGPCHGRVVVQGKIQDQILQGGIGGNGLL